MKPVKPVVWALLGVFSVYLAIAAASAYEEGSNIFVWMGRFSEVLKRPSLLRWTPYTVKCIVIVLLLCAFAVLLYRSDREKRRPGGEYGTAKWEAAETMNQKYADKDGPNVILTQHVSIGTDGYKHQRNLNVLVVGGSGSGKTRYFCKPGLMDANCSYLVVDPKGEMLRSTGHFLKSQGYDIKVFDLIHPRQSDGYNPFRYIREEPDVLKLMDNLVKNTTPPKGASNDPFWEKAEIALDSALMLYLLSEAPKEEQTFEMLMFMLNSAQASEEDEQFQSPLDLLFQSLEDREPDHLAVKQYKVYKKAAGKTAKSILISCGARLAVFDIAELREVTAYDELELDTLGDRKTALFLIMSDTDDSFNFLISMCYTQLFNLLCEKADDVYDGRLPVHVRCLIDECANIGQIPKLEKLVATIRSREISACLVLQAQSQLKAIYKDNADTIIGNMDTSIFLGGKEPTTLKELAAVLGKETIDTYNTGESRGRETSHSLNYQKLGKELMSQDELAVMDGGKCILQLRGVRPFLSDKYDITKHPNFQYTADADDKNAFDIEAFLSARLKLKPNEVCEVYEVDTKGA